MLIWSPVPSQYAGWRGPKLPTRWQPNGGKKKEGKIGKIYSSRVFRFQYITPEQSSFQISHHFVVSNLSHLGVILQLPLLFYTHFIAKFLFALLFYTHLGYWPGEISHQCDCLLEYRTDAGMACKMSHRVITAVKKSHIIQSSFYFVHTEVIDLV